ncbi:MAG: DMT family transporter [Spirochaetaceae bacterium]|jgi:drug/metabolite transporter (DMT)-like permease|nr:DMT family transporter [Spirochaetaceae bacterium]
MPYVFRREILPGRPAVLLCALLWSTSGLFIKLIDADPFFIAGARSLIAALTMLAARCIFMRSPFGGIVAALRSPAFWVSGIAYSATMTSFVVANKLTASANVILLQYSAPVWAALLSIVLLKEKPRVENWIALALVLGGLFIIFHGSFSSGSLAGDMIALASGVMFALNSVCMRMQKDSGPAYSLLLSNTITAFFAFPLLFSGKLVLSLPESGAILFMGTVQIGFASILYAYGIKRVSAFAALIIASIEPVLNPVWVFVVTGEKPALNAISGGLVIVFAVVFSNMLKIRGRGTGRAQEAGPS